MKVSVCKLIPKGPCHFGSREQQREGSDVFAHSDTLFSAICHSFRLLYGVNTLEKMLSTFSGGSSPFLISSTFPFQNDILYLPVPKNQIPSSKETKKIRFVSVSRITDLLNGREIEYNPDDKSEHFLPRSDGSTPWSIYDASRVALSRLDDSSHGGLFQFGEIRFDENAGLFFFYQINDNDYQVKFKASVRLMCEEGLGGGRSVGRGQFQEPIFIDDYEISVPDEGDASYTLSLYYPDDLEKGDFWQKSYYDFVSRRGYIFSPNGSSLRRKSLNMFAESSVFPKTGIDQGALVDVTPKAFENSDNGHKVYRYGMLFSIPCKLEVGKNGK